MSKLPVIYIYPDERSDGYPYIGWPEQWGDSVPYEPAIALCRTCKNWNAVRCKHPWGPKSVPLDGSGFCHLHPGNRRGEDG